MPENYDYSEDIKIVENHFKKSLDKINKEEMCDLIVTQFYTTEELVKVLMTHAPEELKKLKERMKR